LLAWRCYSAKEQKPQPQHIISVRLKREKGIPLQSHHAMVAWVKNTGISYGETKEAGDPLS
jgi:hypothetical protein